MSNRNVPRRITLATLAVVALGAALDCIPGPRRQTKPTAHTPGAVHDGPGPRVGELSAWAMNNFGDMVDGTNLYHHATGSVHDLTADNRGHSRRRRAQHRPRYQRLVAGHGCVYGR